MAAPTFIPIHSNRNQRRGPLGIMHNVSVRSTELAVIYPQRRDKDKYIWQPPEYYVSGVKHYMIWCPSCAEWQRREAFSDDSTRSTGKRGYCKSCENEKRVERRRRSRAA